MSSVFRGGRLGSTKREVVNFISSLQDDKRIARATVLVNEAHVIALMKARAISQSDGRKLLRALRKIEDHVPLRRGVEDIHVLIEEYVTKRLGQEIGGRLHLAKSRNDQVATAIRMVLRQELLELSEHLLLLERELLQLASKHTRTVFPGYTHLQPAQPISFAHYLLAVGDSLLRDNDRILEAYRRVNVSPMGAGALAGSSFNLDRLLEATLLGFEGIIENTLDAVGSRDFAVEALSILSIVALDLSRLAQDLIFYSSAEARILSIPDEFTSTSSIMPQKKNPDPLELVRARSAKVLSNCTSAVTILHSLPSGYNLDFQEITPLLWQSCDTLKSCLKILSELTPGLRPDEGVGERDYLQFTAATEIANILVREEKLPFRTAHRAVGHTVRFTLRQKKNLGELTRAEWEKGLDRKLSNRVFALIGRALELSENIRLYRTKGSPSPTQTAAMIRRRTKQIPSLFAMTDHTRATLNRSLDELDATH